MYPIVELVTQISAVVAIGVAEGLSHVNLRKVYVITWWWIGSLFPICLITAALMAQGETAMSWASSLHLTSLPMSAESYKQLISCKQKSAGQYIS